MKIVIAFFPLIVLLFFGCAGTQRVIPDSARKAAVRGQTTVVLESIRISPPDKAIYIKDALPDALRFSFAQMGLSFHSAQSKKTNSENADADPFDTKNYTDQKITAEELFSGQAVFLNNASKENTDKNFSAAPSLSATNGHSGIISAKNASGQNSSASNISESVISESDISASNSSAIKSRGMHKTIIPIEIYIIFDERDIISGGRNSACIGMRIPESFEGKGSGAEVRRFIRARNSIDRFDVLQKHIHGLVRVFISELE